jgi:pimeloyl-ACP methyl ester carboxylesterase
LVVSRDNPGLSGEQVDRLYDQARPWGTRRAVLRLYRATAADSMEPWIEMFRELDPPALVVWGTNDVYLPREQAQRQPQAFPSARVELLEGRGHWSFVEDPEGVESLVVPFLREQVGQAARVAAPTEPT